MKTKIPTNAKKIALRPLALGEKTGHHHSLVMEQGEITEGAEMFEVEDTDGKKVYLRITAEGVSLQHQEHKTQPIAPGEYEVTIQHEVTDWGRVPVQD